MLATRTKIPATLSLGMSRRQVQKGNVMFGAVCMSNTGISVKRPNVSQLGQPLLLEVVNGKDAQAS